MRAGGRPLILCNLRIFTLLPIAAIRFHFALCLCVTLCAKRSSFFFRLNKLYLAVAVALWFIFKSTSSFFFYSLLVVVVACVASTVCAQRAFNTSMIAFLQIFVFQMSRKKKSKKQTSPTVRVYTRSSRLTNNNNDLHSQTQTRPHTLTLHTLIHVAALSGFRWWNSICVLTGIYFSFVRTFRCCKFTSHSTAQRTPIPC